jgi:hypothetical protein
MRLDGWRITLIGFFALALVLGQTISLAGGLRSDSKVKVSSTATKPDSAGKQTVMVTLLVDKGWHLYANPVNNPNLSSNQTVVKVESKTKLTDVKILYPPGVMKQDKDIGNYMVYEGKVNIQAIIQRGPGDLSPLEINVRLHACDANHCLVGASVKNIIP